MIRGILKRSLESAIIGSGVADRLSARVRGQRIVLAYHNVVPDGEHPWGENALHLPHELFREQLDILAECAETVPLRALLSEESDPQGQPRVAITFDDAYRGALHAIRETLVPRGVPATVFAPPALLGSSGFWWDQLAHGLGGGLSGTLRERCLQELAGSQEAILAWARSERLLVEPAPEFARPSTEQELLRDAMAEGLSIESHTWTHRNLCALSDAEALDDLDRARRWIRDRGMGPADAIAYPYGLGSESVGVLAARAGHRSGLLVRGGWLPEAPHQPRPFAVPRLNVPSGLSAAGLRIRLAGLRIL